MINKCLIAILITIVASQTQVNMTPSTTRTTTPCQNGYYWTSQSCMQCQQVTGGYCSCTSYQGCSSITCNSGYYNTGTATSPSCGQCPTGCTSCGLNTSSNALVCSACSASYSLLGGLCVSNQNCATFNTQTGICTTCATGYYFNWNFQQNVQQSLSFTQSTYYSYLPKFCTACSSNTAGCISCDQSGYCLQCSSNYYLAQSGQTTSCTQCGSNCATCSSTGCLTCVATAANPSGNTCTTCTSQISGCQTCSYSSSTYTCSACAPGYFLANNQCSQCQATLSNCSVCASATTCQTCATGFLLNTNGNCYQCQPNCSTGGCSFVSGTTQTTCTICSSTYYGVSNSLYTGSSTLSPNAIATYQVSGSTTGTFISCELCSDNTSQWAQCAGPNDSPSMTTLQPTQCVDNWFLITSSSGNTCVQYSSSNTCLTLTSATSNTSCQACLGSTYILVSNTCIQCPANCVSGKCLQGTTAGTSKCEQCSYGYYLDSSSQCAACSITNCALCVSASTCSQCSPGYYINSGSCTPCSTSNCALCPSNSCSTCTTGFYPSQASSPVSCYTCPQNCLRCVAPGGTCQTCNTGYLLQGNGCVSLASANCLSVNTSQGCAVCAYGFYFNNGYCLQCVDPYAGFICNPNLQYINGGTTPQSQTTSYVNYLTYGPGTPLLASQYCLNSSGVQVQYCQQSAPMAAICQNGYYWSGQICVLCLQVTNGYCNCGTPLGCTQITCNAGYASNGNISSPQCIQCATGCSVCTVKQTTTICSTCNTGYSMVNGVCISNQNCASFSAKTGMCQSCQSGYYFVGLLNPTSTYTYLSYYTYTLNYCQPCGISNCIQCPSQYTCQKCNTGFYWNQQQAGGSCSACPSHCSVCTELGCTTCVSGYQIQQNATCLSCTATNILNCVSSSCDGSTCLSCGTGYSLVSNACVLCPSNCSTCTSITACSTCVTGYINNSSNQCQVCPANCLSCSFLGSSTTQTTCTKCADTYYVQILQGVGVCQQCNLATSSSEIWLRCAGPNDTPSMTVLQPTQCVQNYFLIPGSTTANTIATCQPIQAGNSACLSVFTNSTTSCASCQPGYTLVGQSCSVCPSGCSVCQSQNSQVVCTTCSTGLYLSTSGTSCNSCAAGCSTCSNGVTCLTCSSGYYQNSSNICTLCTLANCSTCPGNVCSACVSNYFLYQPTTGSNVCYKCPTNCSQCNSNGQTCTSCSSGYVLNNGGCLSVQQANCATIGPNGCLTCNYGFYLQNNLCFQCVDPINAFVCSTSS
ncbi:hypothetical protein pb186bvf_020246 [Paramecium bursaria]